MTKLPIIASMTLSKVRYTLATEIRAQTKDLLTQTAPWVLGSSWWHNWKHAKAGSSFKCFHTLIQLSTHTHTHSKQTALWCLEHNFNLNLQGINYIRSRSIQHSYINATRLFRCATVITPVIILLRVYLYGPTAEWCITCRFRNHQHFHHTRSLTLERWSIDAQVW